MNGFQQYHNGVGHNFSNGHSTNLYSSAKLISFGGSDSSNINEHLPKEIILKIFSYLDLVTLCHCSQVCTYWHQLAFDGSNWQNVSLFQYQKDIEGSMVEKLAVRCRGFLRSLNLRGCQNLNDSAIKAFTYHCVNLERLNLTECRKLTNESCRFISNCSQLLSLKFNSCPLITDDGLRFLSNCNQLTELDISWCNVTDDGLLKLAKRCHHLVSLHLRGCKLITSIGVIAVAEKCSGLHVLSLQECGPGIRDDSLAALSSHCHLLRMLCLSHCSSITDVGISPLAAGCTQLHTLELAGCRLITDAGLGALARGCPHLERLDLEDCVQVTDSGLSALAAHCSALSQLTLSYCELISDDGIRALASGLCAPESLQILELDNCPLITDAALEHLVACHALQQIELYDCQMISRAGIRRLLSHLPSLKVHAYFAPVTPPGQPEQRRRRYCRCCSLL